MNIGINTRLLIRDRLDGIGWFINETMSRMTHAHPEHHFFFFFDRSFDIEFVFSNNITPVIVHPQARHPILYNIWFQWSLKKAIKKYNIDVFLSPDGFIPLNLNIPVINVIHDIAHVHFPDFIDQSHRRFYAKKMPLFAKSSTRIATVSKYSKNDISAYYGINTDKIDVVFNGSRHLFKPLDDFQKMSVQLAHTEKQPYFIYVGTVHPRKNLVNILKAFEIFKSNGQPHKLVLAGKFRWMSKEVLECIESSPFQKDIIQMNYVSDQLLSELMAASTALLYVSKFEGFGIPILEAMNCEVPVITSNCSSMPEVAGDAALKVDPYKPEQIARAMSLIDRDPLLAYELIEKGKKQALKYNWDKTSSLLYNTILKAMDLNNSALQKDKLLTTSS